MTAFSVVLDSARKMIQGKRILTPSERLTLACCAVSEAMLERSSRWAGARATSPETLYKGATALGHSGAEMLDMDVFQVDRVTEAGRDI